MDTVSHFHLTYYFCQNTWQSIRYEIWEIDALCVNQILYSEIMSQSTRMALVID